jgi:hypothetical protein
MSTMEHMIKNITVHFGQRLSGKDYHLSVCEVFMKKNMIPCYNVIIITLS